MRTITITAMNRPKLFLDLLQSLKINDLSGWSVVVAVEPSDCSSEIISICESTLTEIEYRLIVNDHVLGVRGNPYALLNSVFDSGSALNIYLEEDLVVSPDVVEMSLWYEKNYQPQWLAMNLISGPCGSAGFVSNPAFPSILFESKVFNSLGFVVRAQEWASHIKKIWMGDGEPNNPNAAYWGSRWGWDWSIYAHVAASPELKILQPAFARANHLGENGVHVWPDLNRKLFGALRINDRVHGQFDLFDVDSMPHELRSHVYLLEELTNKHIQVENLQKMILDLSTNK